IKEYGRAKVMAKKILRGFRFADIPIWIKNAFLTILKGRLLITLKIERYFVHIIYTFFLFWVSIYLGMKIEKTMTRVEENRRRLEDIEIFRAHKQVELTRLQRMSTVQEMLEAKGSSVGIPEKPAERIK
ncbi:MAG: FtsL-like putative cell division protein, partial [Candidatus Cryptobacteroides sp.]